MLFRICFFFSFSEIFSCVYFSLNWKKSRTLWSLLNRFALYPRSAFYFLNRLCVCVFISLVLTLSVPRVYDERQINIWLSAQRTEYSRRPKKRSPSSFYLNGFSGSLLAHNTKTHYTTNAQHLGIFVMPIFIPSSLIVVQLFPAEISLLHCEMMITSRRVSTCPVLVAPINMVWIVFLVDCTSY